MRIATFNILHGRSLDDGRVDVDRLAAAVKSLDADVLGLQEVDRDQPRSFGADLTAAVRAWQKARGTAVSNTWRGHNWTQILSSGRSRPAKPACQSSGALPRGAYARRAQACRLNGAERP